jgi:hypothetical protein
MYFCIMTQYVLDIYTPELTERLKYAACVIFDDILGISCRFFTDKLSHEGKTDINYSFENLDCGVRILPAGLVGRKGIEQIVPDVSWLGVIPLLFQSDEKEAFPFDIFSASFYMLSRYEEYQPFHADIHGRFPGSGSFAFRHDFLRLPVVDLWAIMLGRELSAINPDIVVKENPYDALMTFDIDQAYAFLGHGFLRNAGGFLRDWFNKCSGPLSRLKTLLGRSEDPYNLFGYMTGQVKKYGTRVMVFFPVGERNDHDRNPSFLDKNYRALIKRISADYETGIHTSYYSSGRPAALDEEIEHFNEITGSNVLKCRQHWLLLSMPSTYRSFLKAGIKFDYTMGFADETGFRAGIARPFPFYDLLKEEITDLTVVPFQVMDGTLMQYKNLTPDEAIDDIAGLIKTTREAGGLFVSIWHNTSLTESCGWEGWRRVFEETLRIQQQ